MNHVAGVVGKRYVEMFSRLKASGRGAFIPFLVVGDPDIETSERAIEALIKGGAKGGADALELGIPFSDPVADGPTIQSAVVRALESGVTPTACFELIKRVRDRHPDLPIGILTYCNHVMARGMETYFQRAGQAGIDSVLTADMPVAEANHTGYVTAANAALVAPVFIAPPNADDETLANVAASGAGYTYLVMRKGVTGQDQRVDNDFKAVATKLEQHNAPPAVVGFGISSPSHVAQVISAGAQGAISGSATVALLQRSLKKGPEEMERALCAFVQEMKQATILCQEN